MHDNDLYADLLGLSVPWVVDDVTWSMDEGRIDVSVLHETGARFPCPACGQQLAVYDHTQERTWRHLDTCQLQTLVHAKVPRVKCATDGVLQVAVPWAEARARFTMLFEHFAIDVLLRCNQTKAAEILGLSWDEVHHIMERAVARGLAAREAPVAPHLGVDEKAYKKGHSYLTVVSDVERGVVLHLEDDRKKSSLDAYFESLSEREKKMVTSVCMDMWEPYVLSVEANLTKPETKIVFDKFHVVKHMVEAVDRVRKDEHRRLSQAGKSPLTGSKYWWLHNDENVPDRFRESFDEVRGVALKTARAWAIKESLRGFWTYRYRAWAAKYLDRWYSWAIRSRLDPIRKVARMIKAHRAGVLNYFGRRLTNAGAEGLNSRIQAIKVAARGFRNKGNFKTAIYFHLGGLDLYPNAA